MASFLGPGRFEVIVDREKFEKELTESMHKALTAVEAPAKEKHVRCALIATWREKGCASFWKVIQQFPIQRSYLVCWKTCFVIHRAFRDGYPEVVKKSINQLRFLGDIGKHWSRSSTIYSTLITSYIKVLMTRVTFGVKNPEIPSVLSFEDKPFELSTDIDYIFQLTVEVFDLQSALLHFYAAIMSSIDPSKGPAAVQVQCKITPLIPCIQDSAALYNLTFKLMKALHSSLPPDTLQGHRDRFNRQYQALRKYFIEASKLNYLQPLVKIPSLSPDPPSFLLLEQLVEQELRPQVRQVLPEESSLVDTTAVASVISPDAAQFDSVFGGSGFEETFDFASTQSLSDEKDALIEQLMREIVELKGTISEMEEQRTADHELLAGLRDRLQQIESELADYKDIAEQTCNENILLKRQIDASNTEKGAQAEADVRAKAMEEKFVKLREVYQKLRNEHIQLLRTNGEMTKRLAGLEEAQAKDDTDKITLEEEVTSLNLQLQEVKAQMVDESLVVVELKEKLKNKEQELTGDLQTYKQRLQNTEAKMQTESGEMQELKQALGKKEKELEDTISSHGKSLQELKMKLSDESTQVLELQRQLKLKQEESIQYEQKQMSLKEELQLKSEPKMDHQSLVVRAIEESSRIIKKVVEEAASTSSLSGNTCSPAYLLEQSNISLDVVDSTTDAFSVYRRDESTLGDTLASLSTFTHSMGGVVLNTACASHLSPAADAQKLVQASQQVGEGALKFLDLLKQENQSSGTISSGAGDLQKIIRSLARLAGDLVADEKREEEDTLGDIVEEEMSATAHTIEEAARRIQEMLQKARKDDTGVKLEVNERILDSCTGLMLAIKTLIQRSKDLQIEIIGEGMGTLASANEFYKKNSRWSEGLISAAKQVGWGASILVDSADKVVQGTGKFEELVVASHDIAASTAQLVAASRVKAHHKSEKLKSLKSSSRNVSEATGQVVASAQSGADIKRNQEHKMDYSKLSLTQAKRLEMESQVKALELEKELEMERTRLSELRKIHYHLAGASEGWDEAES